jgi:microcompartment protein CcmK/EutM
MFVAKVIGEVVSTIKHTALRDMKLLVVEKLDTSKRALGESLLAVDSVDAGVGDVVLVVDEGGSAAMVTGLPNPPIRTVIVGVIDSIDIEVQGSGDRV